MKQNRDKKSKDIFLECKNKNQANCGCWSNNIGESSHEHWGSPTKNIVSDSFLSTKMERSPTNIGIEISPTKPGVLSTTMGSYIMQWRLFGKDTWSKGEVDGDCSRLRLFQPIRSLFWFDTHDVLVTSLSFAGHKEMADFNPNHKVISDQISLATHWREHVQGPRVTPLPHIS